MSGKIVGDVLKYAPADLTVAQRFVLVALAESARERDRTTRFITARIVAEWTGLSYGTVKNALSELANRGLIRPVRKAHRGVAQDYSIAQLFAYHRATTNRRELP